MTRAGVAIVRDEMLERCAHRLARGRSGCADAGVRPGRRAGHRPHALGHARQARYASTPTRISRMRHIALVHNGIIENYEPLREELRAAGYGFESPDRYRGGRPPDPPGLHLPEQRHARQPVRLGARVVTKRLHGAYAIAVVGQRQPARAWWARAPARRWWWALGENETFLASDALALAGTANRIVYLEEGDVVRTDPAPAPPSAT